MEIVVFSQREWAMEMKWWNLVLCWVIFFPGSSYIRAVRKGNKTKKERENT